MERKLLKVSTLKKERRSLLLLWSIYMNAKLRNGNFSMICMLPLWL